MKNKLKKFLLLFGVISTILVACNFDETHDHFHSENGEKSNFKIQKVKSEFFSKNTQLIGKLNTNKELLKSIDSNNRIITSSDNSFYINTEEATYIEEVNGLHSYTFFINRNLDNVFLENLLISLQEDGTYKSFIVRYNISAQEVEDLKNGINVDTNNRISIEIIDDVNFTQGISNKIIYTPCVTGTNKFWQCSNGVAGHMPGIPGPPSCSADSFSYVINVQWGLCASDDGSIDDIPSGGGSSDGGGGSSTPDSNYDGSDTSIHGNGSNSLNTAPVVPEVDPVIIIKDPCKKVKAPFIKVPSLSQENKNLALNTTQPIEYGFYMMNNANSTTISPFTNLTNGTNGSVAFPEIPLPSNPILVLSHTHNSPANSTYSVPSWEDLDNLSYYMQQYPNSIDPNIVFITITADGTRYAITINNIQKFKDFFYWGMKFDPSNYDIIKLKNKNENFARFYNGDPLQNPPLKPLIKENSAYPEQDLRYFLNMLQSNNAGVDVFEVNSDFTTFTKVVFDKTTNNIIRTNCN